MVMAKHALRVYRPHLSEKSSQGTINRVKAWESSRIRAVECHPLGPASPRHRQLWTPTHSGSFPSAGEAVTDTLPRTPPASPIGGLGLVI